MAAKRFAAPSSYDRSVYNDPSAMPRYKAQLFQQGATVTSAATGQTLVSTQAEAKAIYGDEWTLHSMETDHIVPVKQVHEQLKDNPFLTNEDRREIANIQENFQLLGRSDNASKRDQSNEQFIQNTNSQGKIHAGAHKISAEASKAHSQRSTQKL